MRYTVLHSYAATRDGKRFGPWVAGDVIELDQPDAEWILRDSPGSLEESPRPKVPARNRAAKPKTNRSVA